MYMAHDLSYAGEVSYVLSFIFFIEGIGRARVGVCIFLFSKAVLRI